LHSHSITVIGDKYQPDYDGVAELWFDETDLAGGPSVGGMESLG